MKKILLVEDDKYIAEEIFNRTKMWDMDCLVVEDFKNVLSTFKEYDPSIVLLDISLPFYDGYYWCREIRKISKVPIIFISSKNDDAICQPRYPAAYFPIQISRTALAG